MRAEELTMKPGSRLTYSVIEDNGGGLHLFVQDKQAKSGADVVYAHYNYQYVPGQLVEDIRALVKHDSVDAWDGCDDHPQLAWDEFDEESRRSGGWQAILQDGDFGGPIGAAGQEEFAAHLSKEA